MEAPFFFENTDSVFFILLNKEGLVITANPFLNNQFPQYQGDMKGLPFADCIQPEDRLLFANTLETAFTSQAKTITHTGFRLKNPIYPVAHTRWEFSHNGNTTPGQRLITGIGYLTNKSSAELEFADFIINTLPISFFVIDESGMHLRWNAQMENITGYLPEEISRMRPVDFIMAGDHQKTNEAIRMVFENGYTTLEARLLTRSGETIPFYFTGSLLNYQEKKWLIGTGVDLSNQKKSTEKIRKAKKKYYALFQQASDPILVTDFTGNLLEANTSMCTMFGYSKEELIGLNISELIHTGDIGKQPIQFEQLKTGLQVFSHYEMKRKNGTIIQVEANMKRSGDNMLMAILRDVTGRKLIEKNLALSEKNLRHVLSSSAENFYMISPQYEVLLINKAAERNLKIAWGKTITLGSNILEEIPDNSNEPIKESFDKALGGEKVTYEYHIDLNGLPEWIEVSFIPVIDETNHITGVYVTTKDITERKRTEAEKEAIRYKLNERVKELTTLYKFGQVLQEDGLSLKKLIRRLVVLLPPGWQYPEITAARIVLGNIECRTKNYRDPAHRQIAEFHTSDGTAGMIEVAYLEKQKPETEDAFFAEERYLINLLSEMLRNYLNRKKEAETLKKSEANLHAIFNTTDTIYILVDKKFRVISFNRPALNFVKKELGYELKTGGEWIKYFPADRKAALSTQLRKTLTGSFLNEECAFVHTDGSVNWYEQKAFPIAGEKDQVFGIMMAIMNITEKKLFEQHLLNQQVQEQKRSDAP